MEIIIIIGGLGILFVLEVFQLLKTSEIILKNKDIELSPIRLMLLSGILAVAVFMYLGTSDVIDQEPVVEREVEILSEEILATYFTAQEEKIDQVVSIMSKYQSDSASAYEDLLQLVMTGQMTQDELNAALEDVRLENQQYKEKLAEVSNRVAEQETKKIEPAVSPVFKNGTFTGVGEGYNGEIQLDVVIKNDEIVAIRNYKHRDDFAWFNQAKSYLVPRVISSQSAELDTVSGATYSSRGILEAVKDALSQARVE